MLHVSSKGVVTEHGFMQVGARRKTLFSAACDHLAELIGGAVVRASLTYNNEHITYVLCICHIYLIIINVINTRLNEISQVRQKAS